MTEAKQLIERAIHQILTEKHGPGAVTRRPLSVRYPVEVDAPSDLRAAISAAKYAAHVAEGLMREYARQARGHGLTWASTRNSESWSPVGCLRCPRSSRTRGASRWSARTSSTTSTPPWIP